MKAISILLLLVLLLAACVESPTYAPPANVPEAAARLTAAQAEYAQIAAESTRVAAAGTAQAQSIAAESTQTWQATADVLSVQMTVAAIGAAATRESISANATGTAVAQVAAIEAQLVADEATRVAILRQAERQQLAYQVRMNTVRPWLWGAVVAALVVVALGIVYRIWRISQPVRNSAGDVVALPSNQFQLMPSRMMPRPEAAPLMLPAPVEPGGAIPLPTITRGHILIAATTGSGKTIALRELVDMRPDNTIVIDPHYTPGAWGAARVVYGEEMGPYLLELAQELERRKQARHEGIRQFDAITVATEEMPALVGELGSNILMVWKRIMREGRKFGIYMMVVSQSTRVRALGIAGEGDLLDNFDHVIELGKNAAESEPELVAGMQRPALIRSGHQPPRPIIIPYDPRKDSESPEFKPYWPFNEDGSRQQTAVAPPIINMPRQVPAGPASIDTQWGVITGEQIAKILHMYYAGETKKDIEIAVFGYNGGAAWRKVDFILESGSTASRVHVSRQ